MQQKDLAQKMGCSAARVNKALRGPGNWTLRTFAEFLDALDGEAEISVFGLEDASSVRSNYDAYQVYTDLLPQRRHQSALANPVATVATAGAKPVAQGVVPNG
jgi:hypothetical protein